jgi:hypothetical protein
MASRNVQDADGRVWACRSDDLEHGKTPEGRDISILCTTETVTVPVRLTVGWQWMTITENGLARMISDASPTPRRAPA